MDSILYKILIPLDKLAMKLYRVKYIGLENIPKNGSYILAGNHTSYFDPLIIMSSTNRVVHFLAKIELFKGIKKYFFKSVGVIPVDRSKKNPEVLKKSIEYLKNNKVIGIFPEGTINRTNKLLLPFKKGAVIMAKESSSTIIPFAIKGKAKFLKKNITITFGKPYKVKNDVNSEIEKLENKVADLLRSIK